MRLAPWIIAALLALFLGLSLKRIDTLRDDSQRLERSLSVALGDCRTWRDKDSLSRARVEALELSVREYKRLSELDKAEIDRLKGKNRDLSRITQTQSQTIIALRSQAKDTVIIRDSVPIQAKHVSCGDEWYTFEGLLSGDDFSGSLQNKDSLLLVESIKHGRFLWWKTKKIKSIRVDVESKNPYTEILDLSHIVIEN